MKKKLAASLMAFGFLFSMASGSIASAAPPFCDGNPPTNAPCIPKDW